MLLRLMIALFLCLSLQAQETPEKQQNIFRTNWLIYLYEETPNHQFIRIAPFYSYSRYPNYLKDDFWFWPLLAGYKVSKNPAPDAFPHSHEYQWFNVPYMSLGSSSINSSEDMHTTTLVSFMLMSYFQENQLQNKYLSRSWYSMPILSYYQSETLWEKDLEAASVTWGNPLFSYFESYMRYQDKLYSVTDWALQPASLLLGDDGFNLLRNARWGRDSLFEIGAIDSFALFTFSTSFSRYPGARYQDFVRNNDNKPQALEDLIKTAVEFPTNRMGMFSPIIMFETSPIGYFSWQLLPLFYYKSEGADSSFYLLPLALEFGTEGIRFSPQPKLFPLLYHDEMYGTWDILWPLFRYESPEQSSYQRLAMRFVFDYRQWADGENKYTTDFSILERLLFSYRSGYDATSIEVLPIGLLFKYSENKEYYQWRVLGFGEFETKDREYLQIFFFKIAIRDK